MSLSKRIASATIQLTLSNAFVRLLSLVTMPVLTHLLSPIAYGTATMAGTLISLISVFALAGMDMSYMRAYPSRSSPSGPVVEAFAWRFVLGAGLFAGLCVMVVWPLISPVFSLSGYLGVLVGAGIVLSLMNTMTQTRARLANRYREMSASIVVSGVGSAAVSMGVAYWFRRDEVPLLLAMIVAYLIPVLMLGLPVFERLLKPSGLSSLDRRNILNIGIAGTLTAPAYWVLSSSDRWFLGYFEDAASVGIYSVGYSVAIMGMMANNAILAVWTPETAREYESNPDLAQANLGRVAERIVAGFACIWLAVTAAGGDVIRLLAAPSFHGAANLIPFIAASVLFHGIIHLANASLLLVKRLNIAMWCWIAGGLFCMLLNFILVPWLGRMGAALTQTISFATMALAITIAAQKCYPLRLNWKRLGIMLTGIVIIATGMYPAWANAPSLSLMLKLPFGVLIVSIVLKIMAPEVLPWVYTFLSMRVRQG
jgi:O-antigen/teichoic acid export membrane protein